MDLGARGCRVVDIPETTIAHSSISTIHLSYLTSCFGSLTIDYNDALESLILPNLKFVAGGIHLFRNKALRNISFPALATLGGSSGLSIVGSKYVKRLSFPVLPSAEQLYIHDMRDLESVSFPILKEVGSLSLGENPALHSLNFDELHSVRGSFFISQNPVLESLSVFPVLSSVDGQLMIYYNVALLNISWPSLVSIDGDFILAANYALQRCSCPTLSLVNGALSFEQKQIHLHTIVLPALAHVQLDFSISEMPMYSRLDLSGFTAPIGRSCKVSCAGSGCLRMENSSYCQDTGFTVQTTICDS